MAIPINGSNDEGYKMEVPTSTNQLTQPVSTSPINTNYMNPNFNGWVDPNQPAHPNYTTPMFTGFFYQNPNGYGTGYTFSNFVTIDNNIQNIGANQFYVESLKRESDEIPNSVGLSMNNFVDIPNQAELDTRQYANKPAQMLFNNLVAPIENEYTSEKFGVQPIPVEVDRSMLPKTQPPIAVEQLNKNNNVQQSSIGRKVNNWFTRLLDQRGQDYISSGKLTVDEVSRNAEKIIDDLIAGRIDYSKQSQYLIQPIIIDTLINYCANKLAINRAIQYSLGYVYNDYTNMGSLLEDRDRFNIISAIDDALARNITQSIAIVNQDISVYDLLYKKLTYVKATSNASSLFSLPNDLNNLKKMMKKRY